MPEFTSHAPGSPNWVDLMSPDVDASKEFYSAVFGWDAEDQLDDDGNRTYVMFSVDGKAVAGLGGQAPDMGEMPAIWNSYFAVDDVAATAAKVEAAGGSVMMPPCRCSKPARWRSSSTRRAPRSRCGRPASTSVPNCATNRTRGAGTS